MLLEDPIEFRFNAKSFIPSEELCSRQSNRHLRITTPIVTGIKSYRLRTFVKHQFLAADKRENGIADSTKGRRGQHGDSRRSIRGGLSYNFDSMGYYTSVVKLRVQC